VTDPFQYSIGGNLVDEQRLVVVPGGARGGTGAQGDQGPPGAQGSSIEVLGAWSPAVAYTAGQAVSYQSSANVGLTSLWVVVEGQVSTLGVPPTDEPGRYVEIGAAGSADILGSEFSVEQLAHPFTMIGQPVAYYPSTGNYQLADTRQYARLGFGLIKSIEGPSNFTVQVDGKIAGIDDGVLDAGTWDPGQVYYVSVVPGQLTLSPGRAAGYRSMPILIPMEVQVGTGLQTGVILGWGPEGMANVNIDVSPPVGAEVGDLWYRMSAYPGLYVLMATDYGDRWVQSNG